MGLEKFAKRHQIKAMAEESKRYQVLQKADDKVKQKKVMEKKVALEKGLKFKGFTENDLPYLF